MFQGLIIKIVVSPLVPDRSYGARTGHIIELQPTRISVRQNNNTDSSTPSIALDIEHRIENRYRLKLRKCPSLRRF